MARLAGLKVGDPRDGAADVEAVAQQRVRLAVALHRAVLRRERRRIRVLQSISRPWVSLLDACLRAIGQPAAMADFPGRLCTDACQAQ